MRYEDTIIYESYRHSTLNNNKEIINEGFFVPLLLVIGAPLMAWAGGKTGLTDKVAEIFEKAFGFNPIDFLNIPGVNLVKWIEPTGVTNWGDVAKFQKLYDENPTEENKWKLYEALFYTIPVVGKYSKVLAGISRSGRSGFKAVPWLYRFPVMMINRALEKAFANPKVRAFVIKAFRKQPANVQRTIAGVLGASLMRMLGIRLAATGAIEFEKDAEELAASVEDAATPGSREQGSSSSTASSQLPDAVRADIERVRSI
jgi:hypothetical protein